MKALCPIIVTIFCSCFVLSNTAIAQDSLSKISLGIHYTPSFSFVSHKNQGNLNNELYQSIVDDELQRFVNPVSAQVYYKVKPFLELRAGLGYHQLGHKTNIYESQLTDGSFQKVQFRYNHTFFAVPLSINYCFRNFFAGVGADLNFHLKSTEQQIATIDDGISRTNTELTNKFQKFYPLIYLTLGYQQPLGQKMHVSFAPTAGYAPIYLFGNDVQINRKYWVLGLNVGLVYGF